MKEGWMKNDEGWFQAVEGFCWWTDRQTNEQMDNGDCCRFASATENFYLSIFRKKSSAGYFRGYEPQQR